MSTVAARKLADPRYQRALKWLAEDPQAERVRAAMRTGASIPDDPVAHLWRLKNEFLEAQRALNKSRRRDAARSRALKTLERIEELLAGLAGDLSEIHSDLPAGGQKFSRMMAFEEISQRTQSLDPVQRLAFSQAMAINAKLTAVEFRNALFDTDERERLERLAPQENLRETDSAERAYAALLNGGPSVRTPNWLDSYLSTSRAWLSARVAAEDLRGKLVTLGANLEPLDAPPSGKGKRDTAIVAAAEANAMLRVLDACNVPEGDRVKQTGRWAIDAGWDVEPSGEGQRRKNRQRALEEKWRDRIKSPRPLGWRTLYVG